MSVTFVMLCSLSSSNSIYYTIPVYCRMDVESLASCQLSCYTILEAHRVDS